ncbi:leucine-rich PPR motif-containing protein, mitochondrial [Engraulis encrasicolus]|uniref:leucine-rich PPR motif-containing protein, mitochondrial n=1 Tax=Engraulis encrasicolus TaxID=184585 RepID=UPI002FD095F7
MAALLRSARALKFSPSSLLQVAVVTKNGTPLNRLYSGTTGARGIGFCTRQGISSSVIVNRLAWPSAAVPGVRQYGVAAEQKGSSGGEEGSVALRSKQTQQFDWALAKLDNSVRRTGRITKTLLLRIFHDICRSGYPSGNQALLLLRSCGSLLPEMPLVERTELAHRVWDKLQEQGASYDASHYNALLKVYLQNEHKFSPTEFLAKMEAANVQPNRVTYQRLIAAYCQEGDIEGASTILGYMKTKDLPITEAVFNSLVTGHAKAGDMESAESILNVMKGAGIEPGPDTYVALMSAYAEKGDIDKIKQTLETVESTDSSLMDRDLMQVVSSLARSGHGQHVQAIVERMRHERGFVPEAMNLCLSLITQGQEDSAYVVLRTFPMLQVEGQNGDSPDLGNFFLRHCVNMNKPVDKLVHYCKDMKDSGLHTTALQFTLYCALEARKTGLAVELMKAMKEEGMPIRPHYCWPLLTHYNKEKNTAGILEVLKGLQELGVHADADTYSRFVLPSFSSNENARDTLKEAGCDVETEGFIAAELRGEAFKGNLAGLLTLISNPSFPALDLSVFRGSLINGFKKSDDVESMAKITELLYQDKRFCAPPADPKEYVAYFLYNLIDGMTSNELRAKEDKLRQYFAQLKTMNINIPVGVYRGIRNQLDSSHVPELIKDVIVLTDAKESLSPGAGTPIPKGVEGRIGILEKRLADLKAEGKPFNNIFKQLIQALCNEEKLDRALELKVQHEEHMTPGCYAVLITLCCRHDNLEEALSLKRELARKDSSVSLDSTRYMTLVRCLAKHGRLEEAVEVLKEMKERDAVLKDTCVTIFFHTLSAAAQKGDVNTIRTLQETAFALGLIRPNNNICSPLISAYLETGDLSGALDASIECHRQYNQLPRIHDIITGLVEKGETEILQKAMDFISQERGEMTMLYDLFFAFLQTARYKEARKIIETPGLRARPGRLQWYAEKCIALNQMEVLENLVDLTGKLFECDRDEMYHYALRLCSDMSDWRKAESLWTKMQEENVIPRERTLRLLASILKSNGQEVPFEVPETWYDGSAPSGGPKVTERQVPVSSSPPPAAPPSPPSPAAVAGDVQMRIATLCKKGKTAEALEVLKAAEEVPLRPAPYDVLIRSLLAKGNLEDAMAVRDIATSRIPEFVLSDMANSLLIVTHVKRDQVQDAQSVFKAMLQSDQMPTALAVTRLVQGLASHGEVAAIQEVEQQAKTLGSTQTLSTMLFLNNTALAHIKNDDLESAIEMLEGVYTGEPDTVRSISYVFRKVLEDKNFKAVDKLAAMAERLANHFASYRAASDLFLQYVDAGHNEEAKFLLQRCAAVSQQKDFLVSYVVKASQQPGQVNKIKAVVEMVPDCMGKTQLYSSLMKCHGVDKDLASAKALYEQVQKEGLVMDELFMKRLALLYTQSGETVPFQEPPESFKFYANKLREQTKTESTEE